LNSKAVATGVEYINTAGQTFTAVRASPVILPRPACSHPRLVRGSDYLEWRCVRNAASVGT
jgi:hypothetical protein